MIDIDLFKGFNDHYGHLAGDDCLKKVAQVLNQQMRRPADLLARYGGEEFIIMLPNTDLAGAKHVAERILESMEAANIAYFDSEVSDRVTLSMGLFCSSMLITPTLEDKLQAVELADQALYQAKHSGRNQLVIYSPNKALA